MSPDLRHLLSVTDRRIAAVAEAETKLKIWYLELTRLREQVGKAQLSADIRTRGRPEGPRHTLSPRSPSVGR